MVATQPAVALAAGSASSSAVAKGHRFRMGFPGCDSGHTLKHGPGCLQGRVDQLRSWDWCPVELGDGVGKHRSCLTRCALRQAARADRAAPAWRRSTAADRRVGALPPERDAALALEQSPGSVAFVAVTRGAPAAARTWLIKRRAPGKSLLRSRVFASIRRISRRWRADCCGRVRVARLRPPEHAARSESRLVTGASLQTPGTARADHWVAFRYAACQGCHWDASAAVRASRRPPSDSVR